MTWVCLGVQQYHHHQRVSFSSLLFRNTVQVDSICAIHNRAFPSPQTERKDRADAPTGCEPSSTVILWRYRLASMKRGGVVWSEQRSSPFFIFSLFSETMPVIFHLPGRLFVDLSLSLSLTLTLLRSSCGHSLFVVLIHSDYYT